MEVNENNLLNEKTRHIIECMEKNGVEIKTDFGFENSSYYNNNEALININAESVHTQALSHNVDFNTAYQHVLAHEYGHYLDKPYLDKFEEGHQRDFVAYFLFGIPFKGIYKTELRAWINARKVLNQFEIEYNEAFENYALLGYKKSLGISDAEEFVIKRELKDE